MMKDNKGQGALEYLLLIGGAVLIAAIVIAVMATSGTKAKDDITAGQDTYGSAREELENVVTTE